MDKRERRLLLALTLAAFLLRLFRIGAQSLWVDEMLTLSMADPDVGRSVWEAVKYNIHGPLHAFVVYLFRLVSTNDGWLRLPSCIAGAASVYFLHRWVSVWLGSRIAWIAAILFTVHPLHLYYSQEVRNYSFLVLFTTISSYYLHRILGRDSLGDFVRYVPAVALAALSNFSAAFLYAVHAILYVARRGPVRGRLLRWLVASVVILVLISPWVYRITTYIDVGKLFTPVMPGELDTTERLRGETTVGPSALPYLCYAFSVGFSLGPSVRELHHDASLSSVIREHGFTVLWVGVLFGAAAVLGIVALARRRRAVQATLYIIVPLAFLMALTWQNAKVFNVRYLLVAFPAYLCILAAGVESLPRVAGRALMGLMLVTLLYSAGNYYFNGRYAREDVRAAARHLGGRVGDGECILAPTVNEVFQHYYGPSDAIRNYYAPAGTPKTVARARLERAIAGCEVLWYVRARAWVQDPEGEVERRLDAEYDRAEVTDLTGVTVIRYVR